MVPGREWIQPIRHGFQLLRAHIVTFFRLACHGKGWRSYTKAAFFVITETHFAFKSQVKERLNSTERLHVDATIMRCFQAQLFSRLLPSSYAGHVNHAGEKP